MSNSIHTLVSAQGTAAQTVITLLTEARLIGSNKHTKLNAARESILEVLPKLYAELNRIEQVTRKNMYNVVMAVSNMHGRAKWADHDNMMSILEAALEGFIAEAATVEVTTEAATTEVTTDTASVTTESATTEVELDVVYVSALGTQWKLSKPAHWPVPAVWLLTPSGWVMQVDISIARVQYWLNIGAITKLK